MTQHDDYEPLPQWKDRLLVGLSGVLLIAIGGILMWAHLGEASSDCQQEAMGYQAVLQAEKAVYEENLGKWELRSIHDLAARKVAEQELAKTQQELGTLLAKTVVIPEPAPMTQTELMLARMAESKPVQAVLGRFKVAR